MTAGFSFSQELKEKVDLTVSALAEKKFKVDPIAGENFSRFPSIVGSMQKRHGLIIESAILEAVGNLPNYTVWQVPAFHISQDVIAAVSSANNVKNNPDWIHLLNNSYPYTEENSAKTIQVDMVAFNRSTKDVVAMEIKRGYSTHDGGKKKAILKDVLSIQMLLKSYAENKTGEIIDSTKSLVCSYYSSREFNDLISVDRHDLDDLFGSEICLYVEQVNQYYQEKIQKLLGDLTAQAIS